MIANKYALNGSKIIISLSVAVSQRKRPSASTSLREKYTHLLTEVQQLKGKIGLFFDITY
ncbi:MAG: hypothetical protein R2875_05285 [Desulfobacterales bacterium]